MMLPVCSVPVNDSPATQQRTGRPRILLVDSDALFLDSAAAYLRRAGYLVQTSKSSAMAMRLIAQRVFDVLVVDVAMPHGKNFVAAVREFQSGPPWLKMVLASSNPGADLPDFLAVGAQVIQKPILRLETLVKAIEQAYKGGVA
jgi:CheY-like chemotaxis protein